MGPTAPLPRLAATARAWWGAGKVGRMLCVPRWCQRARLCGADGSVMCSFRPGQKQQQQHRQQQHQQHRTHLCGADAADVRLSAGSANPLTSRASLTRYLCFVCVCVCLCSRLACSLAKPRPRLTAACFLAFAFAHAGAPVLDGVLVLLCRSSCPLSQKTNKRRKSCNKLPPAAAVATIARHCCSRPQLLLASLRCCSRKRPRLLTGGPLAPPTQNTNARQDTGMGNIERDRSSAHVFRGMSVC